MDLEEAADPRFDAGASSGRSPATANAPLET